MNDFKKLKGSVISGRKLKEIFTLETYGYEFPLFIKITNPDMDHHGFRYKIGKNTDARDLTSIECHPGGLYFTPCFTFDKFLSFGNGYHEVTFDDDEQIFIEEDKCKAKTITLGEKKYFSSLDEKDILPLVSLSNFYEVFFMKYFYKIPPPPNDHKKYKTLLKKLSENRNLVLAAVKYNGKNLEFVCDKFKNDPEIVSYAVKNNECAIIYTL